MGTSFKLTKDSYYALRMLHYIIESIRNKQMYFLWIIIPLSQKEEET